MSNNDSNHGPQGNSRREFLADLGLVLGSSIVPALARGSPKNADSYPANDIRHYGIVADRQDAAEANTATLANLLTPSGSFSGELRFPNTSGSDVYYFNDLIPCHDGVHIDLMGSTLHFGKQGVQSDTDSGFFHALRDFSIVNGTIVVDYHRTVGFNTGNALAFGARGSDSQHFPNVYDSLQPAPLGKIVVQNIHIVSNADGGEGRGIFMLGGLDGVHLENVTIDGQGKLFQGVYYEFGWATNEPQRYLRQTSHAFNVTVRNLVVSGVMRDGFGAEGLYRANIDGIKVTDAGSVCGFGPGESTFFRVWSGVPNRESKPNIIIRNATGERISMVGVDIAGASKINSGFLDNPPAHDNPNHSGPDQETDLIDFTLEDFTISGTPNNYGVLSSAGRAIVRNGTITGFQRGVVTTQECTKYLIEGVKVYNSTGIGMMLGQPVSIHNPPRLSTGIVRGCIVAGSGTKSPSAAITVGSTQSCVIENNRFGYDESHDRKSESTQTQAVIVAADASGVICRGNFVGGIADNSTAYALAGANSPARECRLSNNGGNTSASGSWYTDRQAPAVQSLSSGSVIPASSHIVWVSCRSAVNGIRVQPGTHQGQRLTIVNNSPNENSVGFGPSSESNVEDGAHTMAGTHAKVLVWHAEKKLWRSLQE